MSIFHKDQPSPQVAFDAAIAEGRLSRSDAAPNYAGNYMFMGRAATGKLLFKHRDTREYLS